MIYYCIMSCADFGIPPIPAFPAETGHGAEYKIVIEKPQKIKEIGNI